MSTYAHTVGKMVLARKAKNGWVGITHDEEVARETAALFTGGTYRHSGPERDRWAINTKVRVVPIRIASRVDIWSGIHSDLSLDEHYPAMEMAFTIRGDVAHRSWGFKGIGARWERDADALLMRFDEEVGEGKDAPMWADLEIKIVRARMPDQTINFIPQTFVTNVRRAGRKGMA